MRKHAFQSEITNANAELFLAEESRKDAILTAYKEELAGQLEELLLEEKLYLLQAEFVLCEEEEQYGKIEKINVVATYRNSENRIQIEPVQIGGELQRDAETDFLSPMEIHIKNKLAGFYNVEESNINVIVRETSTDRTSSTSYVGGMEKRCGLLEERKNKIREIRKNWV